MPPVEKENSRMGAQIFGIGRSGGIAPKGIVQQFAQRRIHLGKMRRRPSRSIRIAAGANLLQCIKFQPHIESGCHTRIKIRSFEAMPLVQFIVLYQRIKTGEDVHIDVL